MQFQTFDASHFLVTTLVTIYTCMLALERNPPAAHMARRDRFGILWNRNCELYGMMWHIVKNGWEVKEFIRQRVYGYEDVLKEIEKWPPDEVELVSGVPGEQLKRVAQLFATQKPATLIWCMGQTQHTVGTANVRASCIALLLTGNVGKPGTGANIFRGHDNVQGATDVGLDIVTLLYYRLTEGAWKHWARVREVEYDYLVSRFDSNKIMETSGIPLTRWFDATVLPKDQVATVGVECEP
jgi:formate dehydrogenase major subunit